MRKVKIMMMSMLILAVVAGVLAFKTKVASTCLFTTSTTDPGEDCKLELNYTTVNRPFATKSVLYTILPGAACAAITDRPEWPQTTTCVDVTAIFAEN